MDLLALRDQVETLRKEIGLFGGAAFLEAAVEELSDIGSDPAIHVDCFLSSAFRGLFSSESLRPYDKLKIRLLSETAQLGCSVGLARPAAAVFICLREEISQSMKAQAIWKFFLNRIDQYAKCRLLVIGANADNSIDLLELGVSAPDQIEVMFSESSADLLEAFSGFDDPQFLRQVAQYKYLSAAPVVEHLKQLVSAEASTLQLRRQIIVSEQEKSRRGERDPSAEVQATIRNALQQGFQDTERVFRQKYDELCRPNVGALAKLIEKHANTLDEKCILKIDKAANFEKFEANIDPQFVNDSVQMLQRAFTIEMRKDAMYVEQLAQATENKVSAALHSIGYAEGGLDELVRPQLDQSKLDQSHFLIGKVFRAELTKPGIMEYFGALRDYTGLIMVIVGILAPLTMLATAPDADKDSAFKGLFAMINKMSVHMKDARAIIQFFSILLILGMLTYGVFDLRRRIPNKRRQELEKALEDAKEFLTEQMTRLLSNAHRDWSAVLGLYVKEYSQALQAESDALIKKQTIAQQVQAAQRRDSGLLEQASVEHKLKITSGAERSVENLVRRFQDSIDRKPVSRI